MHVMLDLETLGTRPGAILRSIGAVAFTLDGMIGACFDRNIDQDSCIGAGLHMEADAVAWWQRQSAEVEAALLVAPHLLAEVVEDFHRWFKEQGATELWCHGANFDEPLWRAAAYAVNQVPPWKYWNVRCTRTLYAATGFDPKSVPRIGLHHSALDDALTQVHCVQRAIEQRSLIPA